MQPEGSIPPGNIITKHVDAIKKKKRRKDSRIASANL